MRRRRFVFGLLSISVLAPGLPALAQHRILKGEKSCDIRMQQPTKFEMIVDLKSAKALALVVPAAILARADEVMG